MERDDLIRDNEYSLSANHDAAHGQEIRKTIWFVTILLTVITIVEVLTGAFVKQYSGGEVNGYWPFIKWSFIVLTLVKAGYIVLKFMHLGDETKSFKYILLVPYFIFIAYLIFILVTESSYWNTILFP
ncbi:MAG: cytochrome C oxidase subunit IV family protein [Flavobacteriales bacterium]|nr:cytochrome C oxidase subunit IV family protein [Flavobacteriales bacterium]